MPFTVWRAIGCAALMLAACLPAHAQAERGIRVEFESGARGRKEQISGYLSFPAKALPKYPLMLVMHSSGGIHERDWFFARVLNEMGVATLVLDSFGPRGLSRVYEKKRSFGEREQAIDALTALEFLGATTGSTSLAWEPWGALWAARLPSA